MNESAGKDKPFHLAARAVILDEQGRCLLIRRSRANRSFVGTWEWPGGKADPGETFDVTVQREVAEETGLQIQLTGVAGAFHIEMPQMHLAVLCMEAKACGGTLRLSEEHDDSAWVPPAEMSKWNLTVAFREFAEAYVKRKSALS